MLDAIKLIRFIMVSEAKSRVKPGGLWDFTKALYSVLEDVTTDTGRVLDKIREKRQAEAKRKGGQ